MTRGASPQPPQPGDGVAIRPAEVEHAAEVWSLARGSGVLDENSPYAYLLAFRHHGDTSVVALDDDRVVGFVLAYRPPRQPETVFVWQVGVAESHRRLGLGLRLLRAVLDREACAEVSSLEATVTPSNLASLALFRGLARDLGAGFAVTDCFEPDDFPPGAAHEAERLVRVGPISRDNRS